MQVRAPSRRMKDSVGGSPPAANMQQLCEDVLRVSLDSCCWGLSVSLLPLASPCLYLGIWASGPKNARPPSPKIPRPGTAPAPANCTPRRTTTQSHHQAPRVAHQFTTNRWTAANKMHRESQGRSSSPPQRFQGGTPDLGA